MEKYYENITPYSQRLLKKGYCIEQSHRIASKNVGN